ncbi:flagellar protein MotY [Plesiomonas sp.]|uniref:flagellar protein MotY n=1 Tax=Plesiomonas sp. TaxID=2486279 RepID=UPI003EE78AFB
MIKCCITRGSLQIAMAGLLMSSLPSWADTVFFAGIDDSKWVMTQDTPLECRLEHAIPNYGTGAFTSRASKKINLDFELQMFRPMAETRRTTLLVLPPRWMPGTVSEPVTTLTLFQQFDGYVADKHAWQMLAALEKGRLPTLQYRDAYYGHSQVQVSLSPAYFKPAYKQYLACVQRLLPYNFDDIAYTVLHYQPDSEFLVSDSQQKLAKIAEYVKHIKDVELVLVAAHGDDREVVTNSEELARKRAETIQNYFVKLGLKPEQIQLQVYGDKRPVADNRSPTHRGLNRRLIISLARGSEGSV